MKEGITIARHGRGLGGLLCTILILTVIASHAVVFTSQLVTNLPAAGGNPCDSAPSAGAALGGYFYFAASDGPNGAAGRELWRTDGTPGGTALFKDIYPGAADSSPEQIVTAGTNLLFVANDGVHGKQLWKSDGTAAGTVRLTALGTNASIAAISPIGNGACFVVVYGIASYSDLFRTDGTAAGTFALTGPGGYPTTNHLGAVDVSGTDIAFVSLDYLDVFGPVTNTLWRYSGTGPYVTYQIAVQTNFIVEPRIVGTNCYFVTSSNYTITGSGFTNSYSLQLLHRASLLALNGPVQQVDSTPASAISEFNSFAVANGHLFYSYDWSSDPVFGDYSYGPWKAVAQSGAPVAITTNGSGAEPIIGTIGANVYYWDGNTGIFRTDGASSGVVVLDLGPLGFLPYAFQQVGADFFFVGGTPSGYSGLGVTDLTARGTHDMSDAAPGPNGSVQAFLGTLGNLALYRATDDQIGNEPYRSDGTTNGTFLLQDIAAGTNTPPPAQGVASGGLFYFTLGTANNGVELWRSDGTAGGTMLLKDIRAGTNSSSPSQLTAWNGLLFFSADDGTNGAELWRSDGTPAGTFLVKDIRPGAAGSNPTNLTPAGAQLFFVADDGTHGPELWSTDGTGPGTMLVQDIVPGVGSGNIRAMAASGSEVHFLAGPTNTSGQLWFSTGQPGAAQFLKDFGILPDPTYWPRDFTSFGGKAYFGIYSPAFSYLAVTDDTPGGTGFVGPASGVEVSTVGGVLFTTDGSSLKTSDGTLIQTVTNLPNGVANLTPLRSQMYFVSGSELWFSDSTTNGTSPVARFSNSSQAVANLTPFDGALIFTAATPLLGRELWATAPGQGATLIEDLSPQSGNANLQLISAGSNQVFYIAKPAGQSAWQLRTLHLQTLAPPPSGPYGGTPWPVPGLIEAENFDLGGEGVAYHDTTADNEGGAYRPYEGVDLETCDDTNGGFCVFATRPGEWIDYTVNAAYTGIYQIEIRMTSAAVDTGTYHFEVDGVPVGNEGVFNNGTPGGWVTIVDALPFFAGVHVLRVVYDQPTSAGDVGTFNWFNFTALETNQPPTVFITFPPNGGIVSTDQPVRLHAQVVDPTTWSPPAVEFRVDGQSIGVASNSPYTMAWTPTPGAHTASATATDSFGASSTSSNVLFFAAAPYLPEGSFWRVNAFGTNLLSSWRSPTYDDSHWPRLRAPFGFGYPGIRTLVPSNYNNSPIPTFYFRTTFSNSLSAFNFASITLTRDDAAVVWINGQQLARVNLPQPPTNVVFTNLALTNVINNSVLTNAAEDVLVVPLTMLVDGTNLIAVEIHQGEPSVRDNFDMKFDLSFSTFNYAPPPLLTIFSVTNGVTVQWADSLTNWALEHSLDLNAWSPVTNPPTDNNGFFDLRVTPPSNQREFFRLHQNAGP